MTGIATRRDCTQGRGLVTRDPHRAPKTLRPHFRMRDACSDCTGKRWFRNHEVWKCRFCRRLLQRFLGDTFPLQERRAPPSKTELNAWLAWGNASVFQIGVPLARIVPLRADMQEERACDTRPGAAANDDKTGISLPMDFYAIRRGRRTHPCVRPDRRQSIRSVLNPSSCLPAANWRLEQGRIVGGESLRCFDAVSPCPFRVIRGLSGRMIARILVLSLNAVQRDRQGGYFRASTGKGCERLQAFVRRRGFFSARGGAIAPRISRCREPSAPTR